MKEYGIKTYFIRNTSPQTHDMTYSPLMSQGVETGLGSLFGGAVGWRGPSLPWSTRARSDTSGDWK